VWNFAKMQKIKSKKGLFCQNILIFLEKKLLDFVKKDWNVFSLHLDSDFRFGNIFELFRPCWHSMLNDPSFGFALPKPSFLLKFFD
jgi:hypothetical protein